MQSNKNKSTLSEENMTKGGTGQLKADASSLPIVAIGASAGGLEAMEQFFENMPDNAGLAFVVIQHLDPNHKGMMPELLQRITPMRVSQASDGLRVKPNCVYVIPPNKSLSLLHGALHLFDTVKTKGLRLPIDIFFRSLAVDRQENGIGIILSGMGSDGSLGLKAIKENNGIVLVQDPASAKFDGMPRSAIDAVIADVIAPASELPAKLISLLKLHPRVKTDAEIESKVVSNIDKIIILLRENCGHDFSEYKKTTLFRRIERRKGVHQLDRIQDYVRFLQENPREVEILFKELLIGVTNFFRDAPVWELLKNNFLPKLLDRLPKGYEARAWVAGCSTGEEAYSLAIVFKEVLENLKKRKNINLQIFATDLDTEAIDVARRGYFPKNILADVSPERLARFFHAEDEGYHINTNIREMVVFAPHNVIKDPPFTKLDILTCRNMLIYMEPGLQHKLISLFNYSLNTDGLLLLGTAESLGGQNEGFAELDGKHKFYQRTASLNTNKAFNFPSSFRQHTASARVYPTETVAVENIQTLADQVVLQRFAPASVLVNGKGDIVYITGRTGKYLEPVAGKANWNIHAMARAGLREKLPGAFRKALQHYDREELKNVKIDTDGGTQLAHVTVQRIKSPEAIRDMLMVVFADVPDGPDPELVRSTSAKGNTDTREKELEMELQQSREEVRSIREEMQTSQEELKSTNEELQSTNEELQSSNEELTSSKEEMQSLNEELQTVNIELQSKVADFVQANNDMKNLLNSTGIATLFLDRELNIRRFTDPVARLFNVRPTDIGRPFTDLTTKLQYPEIHGRTHMVLKTLTTFVTDIATDDQRWFNVRIMPYRTVDDRIDGLVITFSDITLAKHLEIKLKEANAALKKGG